MRKNSEGQENHEKKLPHVETPHQPLSMPQLDRARPEGTSQNIYVLMVCMSNILYMNMLNRLFLLTLYT